MFRLIIAMLCVIFASRAVAETLTVGITYRLGITLADIKEVGDTETTYIALKNSKFFIISKTEDGDYVVRFDRIIKSESANPVRYDKAYILEPTVSGVIPLTAVSKQSNTGLSSGPLVVPFKYRLNDNSLSGDATIGYYAGANFEPGCVGVNWCIRITPLISAGLSQVSVANADGSGSDNKTSVTWATGLLITDWANMNIGLIYGQDRIGDKSWEHEGRGWFSFMIGWQL